MSQRIQNYLIKLKKNDPKLLESQRKDQEWLYFLLVMIIIRKLFSFIYLFLKLIISFFHQLIIEVFSIYHYHNFPLFFIKSNLLIIPLVIRHFYSFKERIDFCTYQNHKVLGDVVCIKLSAFY